MKMFENEDLNFASTGSDIDFEFESDKMSKPVIKLSAYQQKIIDDFKNTKNNMFISARAGAAKTFTLVELTKHTTDYSLFLAFNKSIQQELETRITNTRFKTYTFNGLGYLIMMRNMSDLNPSLKITLDKFKTQNVVREVLGKHMQEFSKLNFEIQSLLVNEFSTLFDIGKAKFIDFNDKKQIMNIINSYKLFEDANCPMPQNTFDYIKLIDIINMEQFEQQGLISFGDQLYITLKKLFAKEWKVPSYLLFQNIFIDESQDVNKCQQLLVLFIKRKDARIIAVGDVFQAIYAFNGSDTNAINNMIRMFEMKEYDLPINYRCPSSHLDYVNKQYPDIKIKACDTAQIGKILTIAENDIVNLAQPGDFILSRKNKDLFEIILNLLQQGKAIYFKDVQFVNKILKKINSLSSKVNTLKGLLDKLLEEQNKNENKLQEKIQKMMAEGQFVENEIDKYSYSNDVIDLFDCAILLLHHYIDDKNITNKSINNFSEHVSTMLNTTNKKNSIVCTSIHQAKGLEANNVFVLHMAKPFYELADSAEQKKQERNLSYIALTRAKQNLYLVDSPSDENGESEWE